MTVYAKGILAGRAAITVSGNVDSIRITRRQENMNKETITEVDNSTKKSDWTKSTVNTSNINREYKSRLFSYLFGREETKQRTLSLYNSLSGTNHTNADDITITTIDDVIYMGMKNDLSYIVTDKVSFYSTININEHQSTWNPNLPIREFLYAARLYDKYLKTNKKNQYSSTIIPLPIPKLVVLYNGLSEVPDESILRLSDAFKAQIRENLISLKENADTISEEELTKEVEEIIGKASPDIEVKVRMININYGRSQTILSTCESLNEYAWLVEQIRSNIKAGMEIDKAADKALDDMPDEFELKEQLLEHKAEVVGMWINEYNEEETLQMVKEEGIKIGEQRGRQEGENLLATLINKLISLDRNDDIPRVTSDQIFRENLYVQFGLKKTI